MRSAIPVWKAAGQTPLEALNLFQENNPLYEGEKISYAGRLDPMAEGVLLLLVGDENKKRRLYENLEKVYEAEIILGVATDTFDALGIIEKVCLENVADEKITPLLKSFQGKFSQKYPPYSSKAVNGKPLYWWARKNKLSEIEIPVKEVEVYSLRVLDTSLVSVSDLYKKAVEKIEKIRGDFRQKDILISWESFFKKNKDKNVKKATIQISCSSGTYVRRLASDIGEQLGCGAIALSIVRLKVGQFSKKDCVFSDGA